MAGIVDFTSSFFHGIKFYIFSDYFFNRCWDFYFGLFYPTYRAKKFGGTKSGIIGATVGLIVGLLFLGPLGIFLGTFLGAFLGELIHDPKNKRTALLAATGSLIGFLTGVFLKFSVTVIFGIYFFKILLDSHNLLW